MISLTEAIEKAYLMSSDGSIKQDSYNLIANNLDEKDRHAFAMALVDRGVHVRTGSSNISKKFQFIAQALPKEEDQYIDTSNTEEEQGNDIPDASSDIFGDSSQIVNILEEAGIRLTSDGKVEFYKSTLPGLYTDKLPQGMDIPTAIKYYEQMLSSHDNEESRMSSMLDLLSRITSQTEAIENSLQELDGYNFNPNSKNKYISEIATGINSIREYMLSGNFSYAKKELNKIKELSDYYLNERRQTYDLDLNVIDALDRMADMMEYNPEQYQESIKGLGAIAKRKSYKYLFVGKF